MPCADTEDGSSFTLLALGIVLCTTVIVASVYLHTSLAEPAWLRGCSSSSVALALNQRGWRIAAAVLSTLSAPGTLKELATVSKVILGFCQLVEPFSRFDYVRWPTLFRKYLRLISINLDVRQPRATPTPCRPARPASMSLIYFALHAVCKRGLKLYRTLCVAV